MKTKLISSLRLSNMDRHAQRVEDCCRVFPTSGNGTAAAFTRFGPCNFRLCPETRQRLKSDLLRDYGEALSSMEAPKHLGLTIPNVPALTRTHVQTLKTYFAMLRKHLKKRFGYRGGLFVIETKHGDTGWHAHVHAIIDMDFVPVEGIRQVWRSATGAHDVYIECLPWGRTNPCPAAVVHWLSYIVKPTVEFDYGNPALVRQFLWSTKNLRLLGAFGNLRKSRRPKP